jgi:16S rRNA processing protein RimM
MGYLYSEACMSIPPSPTSWVWLARIRRPQGRKGEVFAEVLTDFPEKFSERRHLWLLGEVTNAGTDAGTASSLREVELQNHWLHKAGGQSGIVLHFVGVESISDAEALAGLIVAVPLEERAALAEDEVHIADLIGCELIDVAGAEPVVVGRIENVDRSAGPKPADAVPLLIVRGKRGEVLIPFAKSYLRKLDLPAACVEMALPEGLLDL